MKYIVHMDSAAAAQCVDYASLQQQQQQQFADTFSAHMHCASQQTHQPFPHSKQGTVKQVKQYPGCPDMLRGYMRHDLHKAMLQWQADMLASTLTAGPSSDAGQQHRYDLQTHDTPPSSSKHKQPNSKPCLKTKNAVTMEPKQPAGAEQRSTREAPPGPQPNGQLFNTEGADTSPNLSHSNKKAKHYIGVGKHDTGYTANIQILKKQHSLQQYTSLTEAARAADAAAIIIKGMSAATNFPVSSYSQAELSVAADQLNKLGITRDVDGVSVLQKVHHLAQQLTAAAHTSLAHSRFDAAAILPPAPAGDIRHAVASATATMLHAPGVMAANGKPPTCH